jgi:hypothetical protein
MKNSKTLLMKSVAGEGRRLSWLGLPIEQKRVAEPIKFNKFAKYDFSLI